MRGVLVSQAGNGSPDQTVSTPTQGFGCEPLLFLLYNGVLFYGFTALKSITSIISGK